MHGRVKSSVQPSAEEVSAKRAQIGKYVAAKDLFLSRRQQRSMDARTSELTAKLIELNPDFYSLWALRKEQLRHSTTQQSAQHTAHSRSTAQRRGALVHWSVSLRLPRAVFVLAGWLCALAVPTAPLSCARPSCSWPRRV